MPNKDDFKCITRKRWYLTLNYATKCHCDDEFIGKMNTVENDSLSLAVNCGKMIEELLRVAISIKEKQSGSLVRMQNNVRNDKKKKLPKNNKKNQLSRKRSRIYLNRKQYICATVLFHADFFSFSFVPAVVFYFTRNGFNFFFLASFRCATICILWQLQYFVRILFFLLSSLCVLCGAIIWTFSPFVDVFMIFNSFCRQWIRLRQK